MKRLFEYKNYAICVPECYDNEDHRVIKLLEHSGIRYWGIYLGDYKEIDTLFFLNSKSFYNTGLRYVVSQVGI